MKKNILSIAAALTLGLALSACSNDSFEDTNVSYPNGGEIALGVYETETNGDFDYDVVRTVSTEGEDLVYVVRRENADSAIYRMITFSDDTVTAEPAIGMLTAEGTTCFYGDGQNGTSVLGTTTYLAYQNNTSKYTLQMVTSDGTQQFTHTATKKEGFPFAIAGYWNGAGENNRCFVWLDGGADCVGIIGTNKKAQYITYTYNEATGTGTIVGTDGTQVDLAYNSSYQLVATVNGESFIIEPYYNSDSEPEKFVDIAYGNYYTFIFDGTVEGCTIGQSEKDESRYKITPFIYNEDGMVFEVVDGVPYLIDQFTGYVHKTYGNMYCGDFYQYHGETNTGSFNLYTTGKITFAVYYYVSAGYFGNGEDTFTVTEWMDDATRAKVSAKVNKTKHTLTLGNVDLKSNNRTQLQMK